MSKFMAFDKMSPYAYPFYIMFHPRDGFQEMKYYKKTSNLITGAIVVLWLITELFYRSFADFDFNMKQEADFLITFLATVGVFFVVTISNWCFCTMMDGKGSYKEICAVCAYSLLPYIFVRILTTLLSRVMTLDEGILLNYSVTLSLVWSFLVLFAGLGEIHEYSEGKTAGSLVLAVLGMLIILFILLLLATVFRQLGVFLWTVFLELTTR